MKCDKCGFPIIDGHCPCDMGHDLVELLTTAPISQEKKFSLYVSIVLQMRAGPEINQIIGLQDDTLEIIRNVSQDNDESKPDGMVTKLFEWQGRVTDLVTDGFVVSVEDLFFEGRSYPFWNGFHMRLSILEPADVQLEKDARVLYATDVLMMSVQVKGGDAV